jgi:hypothetical protein
MSYFDDHPGEALRTEDQVQAFLRGRLDDLKVRRIQCDVLTALSPSESLPAREQRRAYHTYLMELGNFFGQVRMAHACERLSDEAYNRFVEAAKQTVVPTILEVPHAG